MIARPTTILTMCCFRTALRLQEEFHLDAGELDHVVILERVRCCADLLAVDLRARRALDVGDEVALRPARQDRHLHARLAERGEWFGEFQFLAGIAARKQLDRAERLTGLPCRRRRDCTGSRSGGRCGCWW